MTISLGSTAAQHEQRLLRDLLCGLSGTAHAPSLSVGLAGAPEHRQPPLHCLRACLKSDAPPAASSACSFLAGVADAPVTTSGRCARGYRVTVQPTVIGQRAATLLVVEGELNAPSEPDHAGLLDRVETIGRVIQGVGQLLEENAGFADEVLRNYEQLNFIFDLTKEIAPLLDAREVEKLLCEHVARLLSVQAILVSPAAGPWRAFEVAGGALHARDAAALLPLDDVAPTVDVVRRTRQVQVTTAGARPVTWDWMSYRARSGTSAQRKPRSAACS